MITAANTKKGLKMLSQELITTIYFMGVAASWLLLVLLLLRAICRIGVSDTYRHILMKNKYELEITVVATFASWLFFFFTLYIVIKILCEGCEERKREADVQQRKSDK